MLFGIIGRTGPGMRQVVGFGDRSTVTGTFGGQFGARHSPQGPTGRTRATAPRRGPLAKLLWADLLLSLLLGRVALGAQRPTVNKLSRGRSVGRSVGTCVGLSSALLKNT